MLFGLCTLALVLYLDRVCMGQAIKPIGDELGLSKTQQSLVLMAFTLAYGLFEIPTGRLGDRYGSRGVLTRIVLWWSFFTALTGACWGLSSLLVVRFLFGAGEAGALPNTARVMARWFPVHERGFAQGLFLTCMLLGGAVSPKLAAELIAIKSIGWRGTFVIFGSLGVVWAAAFYAWFRDDPAAHPAVNPAEAELIARGRSADVSEHHEPIPWGLVLTNPNVWLLGTIQTCGAFASYLYMSWYATYVQEARDVTLQESGTLTSLVLAGGAIGSLGGGWFSSRTSRAGEKRDTLERTYGLLAMAGAAVAMLASLWVASPLGASLCIATAACLGLSQQSLWWNMAGRVSGKHLGALFGLLNSLGAIGAMASQFVPGAYVDWQKAAGAVGRAQWDGVYYLYAAVLFVGGLAWLPLRPERSAVEPAPADGVAA